jgi:hypothetical protein
LKVDKVYSACDTIVYPTQLPFWHCLQGNAINAATIDWCNKHVLGYWGYWFDRAACEYADLTKQVAYVGFSNSIDLFLFRMSCPDTVTKITDLSAMSRTEF